MCALGALALALLGLDLLSGYAGIEVPGGVLRFMILVPTAIAGALAGFLMLRRGSPDPRTRRILLAAAVAPLALAALIAGTAWTISDQKTYSVVLGVLALMWAGYATIVALGGFGLRRHGNRGAGLLLAGVGAGLLLQSVGAVAHLALGPEERWPGLIGFYGVVGAGALMTVVLASVAAAPALSVSRR